MMNSEFTIEKGVPIPAHQHKTSLELIELMKSMDVGDSFAYSDDTKSKSGTVRFREAAKNAGITVTIRSQSNGQFRLWRTA